MRPTRYDIFDNFDGGGSMESATFVQMLHAQMSKDSKQEVKLTVRRSRRRPGLWTARANQLFVGRVAYEAIARIDESNYASSRRMYAEAGSSLDLVQAFGGDYWTSPAQRGRKMGRQKKRHKPDRIVFRGQQGDIEIVASPHVGETNILVADLNVMTVTGDPGSHILVSPRNWARLNSEMALMRTYDTSYSR